MNSTSLFNLRIHRVLWVSLTEAERRAIRQVLSDLAAENDDVRLCNQAALDGALMFDQLESDDAGHQSR